MCISTEAHQIMPHPYVGPIPNTSPSTPLAYPCTACVCQRGCCAPLSCSLSTGCVLQFKAEAALDQKQKQVAKLDVALKTASQEVMKVRECCVIVHACNVVLTYVH